MSVAEFTLRLVAETSTTLTLGWTPPAGIQWYLFYADGERMSNAAPVDKNGKAKDSVKFAKGHDQYQVVAVVRR